MENKCNHKPDISISRYLFIDSRKELKCKFCGQSITLSNKGYLLIIVAFILYFVSGLIYLVLFRTFDNVLISILIVGGILFHIAKFVILRYSKYYARNSS